MCCGPPTPVKPGARAPAIDSLYCAMDSRPAVYLHVLRGMNPSHSARNRGKMKALDDRKVFME